MHEQNKKAKIEGKEGGAKGRVNKYTARDREDKDREREEGKGGGGGGGGDKGDFRKSKKRVNMDKKYGMGGKKRGMKRNDSRSLNDFKDFKPKGNRSSGGGSGGGKGGFKGPNKGGNKGASRPGKANRDKARQGRK